MFFLYGYGGTGKTHIWLTLTYALRSQKHIVLTVASSGITSLLLLGGRIANSKFKIPVPTFDNSVCNIHQETELTELLKQTKLIIWDEAPMAHNFCFKALDKSFCDIMGTTYGSILFGGKVVVFGGDFRQILLVVLRGCRLDIVHATINASYLWHQCTVLTLTKNMRLQNHDNESDIKQFSEWIQKMGNGKLSEPNDGSTEIDIPKELLILDYDNPIDVIVCSTYRNLQQHYKNEQFLQFDMSDANDNEACNILTPEFLNSLSTLGLPNHKIKLKVSTPIMLLRNLDQSEGLCNGTRLVITKMANHVLEAKIMSGKNIRNITYIPILSMSPSQSPWPFMLIRRQFPLIVSYAVTINKSQGQSLESVGLYLSRPISSHGQLGSLKRVKSVSVARAQRYLLYGDDGSVAGSKSA
ncbi:PREDICTED: ATP-dependent DNA helicase PIF1-like [Lupinus angustifolius]|uniref:ATP-dependent DNA helicase PIF1-like n=1 Tax=Lupinus angustifolius TaxID=3871 RepID=UPI00092EFE5D|nr:PREDICTED: ATP-dependent DNA helicase PIF1-like [Lupinus angustifolius]